MRLVTLLGTTIQSDNHMAATHYSRPSNFLYDLLKFEPSIRMGKKGDFSDFICGMVVGVKGMVLSISETTDLLGFYQTGISRAYSQRSEKSR